MRFSEFYLFTEGGPADQSDWRSRKVYHTTKTGKRNKVMIRSLPADEQWKYAPLDVKMRRGSRKGSKNREDAIEKSKNAPAINSGSTTMTVYYSADRGDSFDKFEKNMLVVGTDDPAKANEIEDAGHSIAIADGVPLDAFKKYYDYEEKKWNKFPEDISDTQKHELINFSDNDVYLLDFYKYGDQITFSLSN